MIRIGRVEGRGLAVIATERLEPGLSGLKVLTEKALVVFPPMGANGQVADAVPEFLEPSPQMFLDWYTYLQQPQSVKDRVLKLYNDMNCPHANALRRYLENFEDDLNEDVSASGRCILNNIEEFVQFTMVIKFNSVELQPAAQDGTGPGNSKGHGLFETACKMNHSCKPNCVWFTTQDGISKEVRAISTIYEGEELTVDYNGSLLDATSQRRDDLFQTRGFLCNCDRCAAGHDDTRQFKCITHPKTKCSGVHFLNQPTYSETPCLLDCTVCGARASKEYTQKTIAREIDLVREINELDAIADANGIVSAKDEICRLDPPHRYHSLAEKCYQLQGELHSVLGNYKLSAEAYARAIDCRIYILGIDFWSQATAFICEKMGDSLTHVDMEAAEEAYRRTVRALELLRGGAQSDPYAKCAMKKLLTVQNCRRRIESDDLPREECLKGIACAPDGPPTTDFPCQLCGKPSTISTSLQDAQTHYYCCDFHRRVHLDAIDETHSAV
mmetsp:Transcript_26946/g.74065  ORF Transcript_26946/g.74065 Transcript_26946/m.74065 type:complete len:499 (-) Transcript_26946:2063-3559(-)